MLDLNSLRDEFSRYLVDNTGQRHSMDGALMHVCRVAYEQGLTDGHALATNPPNLAVAGSELPEREAESGCVELMPR